MSAELMQIQTLLEKVMGSALQWSVVILKVYKIVKHHEALLYTIIYTKAFINA